MKKSFNFIFCAVIILAVSSCNLLGEKEPQKDSQESANTIGALSEEILNKFATQDTIMSELVFKVDTLTNALNQAQKENTELREKIESIQSPRSTWVWMSIGAIALSIIALLLSLFRRGLNEHEVRAVVGNRLDSSQRIKDLIFNVNTLKNDAQRYSRNTQSTSTSSENSDMRLRQLEKKLEEIANYISGQQQNVQVQSSTQRQETRKSNQTESQHRVGYARIDSENYFTTIYDSNQEGCAFKITFKNESHGEFTIISLDRISSSNDWQQKIECSGVSIKDASDYRIEEMGLCKNIGDNTWEVTQPLKIRLFK